MDSVQIDIGKTIAGKYELVRLIGRGAMGEVWLATHKTLGGEFAIKLAGSAELEGDDSVAGRFQLEAQLSAKFSRKTRHVVSVSDHGEEDGFGYLVMELLDGESLDARLARTGPLSLAETSVIVSQIARALAVAHAEETVHRDLKPANVFLTRDEDGRLLVKVFDFGIARTRKPFQTASPFATNKNMVLGTPSYMSPEQARGLKTLDHRCDVWALAVLAYEALTGNIPWEGETVEEIFLAVCTFRATPILERRSELPAGIAAIFEKAFTSKLDDRFATAIEFAAALQGVCPPEAFEAAGGRPNTLRQRPSAASLPSIDLGSGDLPSVPSGITVSESTERRRQFYRDEKKKTALLPWLILLLLLGVVGVGFVVSRSTGEGAHKSQAAMPSPPPAPSDPPMAAPMPEETPLASDERAEEKPDLAQGGAETGAGTATEAKAKTPPPASARTPTSRASSSPVRTSPPSPARPDAPPASSPRAPSEAPSASPRPSPDRSDIF